MEVKFNLKAQDWTLRLSDEQMADIIFALDIAGMAAKSPNNRDISLSMRDEIRAKMEGQKR